MRLAKVESSRETFSDSHLGHLTPESASRIRRSFSNFSPQLSHLYSYKGISSDTYSTGCAARAGSDAARAASSRSRYSWISVEKPAQ
jgi:hypothetical protein